MTRRAPVVLSVVMTLVASCGSPGPGSPGPGSPGPTSTGAATAPTGQDPGHVLLAIDDVTSWPGSEGTYDPRLVTLTADGTLVASNRSRNVLLPATARTLDAKGIDEAWAAIAARGLATSRSLELPGLFDASTTTIRTDDGTQPTELSIYALGGESAEGSFPPDESGLRANARAAIRELQLLAGDAPWTPPALLLWWSRYEEAPSGMQPRLVPWTAPVDLATAGVAVDRPALERCVRLEGAAAAKVAELARTIPPDVVVEQSGSRYAFVVRPIYPDEAGVDCP